MRELLELQTGQVAFISGLLSGFSLSIATQLVRYGLHRRSTQAVFLMFLLCSLLFLLALYVEVRLSIEIAGLAQLPDNLLNDIATVRLVGTRCATAALVLFILATGSLGWLGSNATGIMTTLIALVVFLGFWFVWSRINTISLMLTN